MEQDHGSVLGHDKNIKFLDRLVRLDSSGQLPISGSYILAGSSNLGKKTALFWFLKNLLCPHKTTEFRACQKCLSCRQLDRLAWPDIHLVKRLPDKKNIAIEQIRELINQLSLSSFAAGYKIGLIYEAETLSEKAANALLKLLEEPNQRVLIFLLVNNLQDLPATIASRSQVLYFRPLSADLIYDYLLKAGAKRSLAKNLAALSVGRPGLAKELWEKPEFLEQQLQQAKVLLSSLGADLNERLAQLGQVLDSGTTKPEEALNLINVWENLARDLLLMHYGQIDLLTFQSLADGLEQHYRRRSVLQLLSLEQNLAKARQYIMANVNPKLVLEQVLIGL